MSLLFYLVAALEQHSCSRELINSVKIEGARGSVVRSLWDFLKNKGGGGCMPVALTCFRSSNNIRQR